MKQEYSYNEWTIKSHAGLFYLFQNETKKARSDDIKSLKAYIDGVMYGHEQGSQEYFNKNISPT